MAASSKVCRHTRSPPTGVISPRCARPRSRLPIVANGRSPRSLASSRSCTVKNTDKAAFFATPTCQEPKIWNTDEANANSALSARLQYIMATSRFAHYLKVMMRDYVGDYMTRENCQNFLDHWIADYVTKDPDADRNLKSEHHSAMLRSKWSMIQPGPAATVR